MSTSQSPHERAFSEFAHRARDELGDSLRELVLFGSTARGETRGVDSDVDVFAVVDTEAQEEELLDLAHEIGFDRGLMISIQTQTVSRFEAGKDHPFVKRVLKEGKSYV